MLYRPLIALTALLALLAVPAMAGEMQLFGSPSLSAAISGTNEFTPGEDVNLAVKVQNTGQTVVTVVNSNIITAKDAPTTAKLLIVTLLPGDAPITVKTDPQMVGDLLGGNSVTATFSVKVSKYAAGGVYTIPLQLNYQYLNNADQVSTDTVRYWYYTSNITLPLDIRVKPGVTLDPVTAKADKLNVGNEGYVIVTMTNAGSEHARNAVAKLSRNGLSPLIPTDASVYLGDFGPGDTREIRFRASVSSTAVAQTYPVDVHVEYTNDDGDAAQSDTATVGVPIGEKIDFAVTSPDPQVRPGQRVTLVVIYRNIGSAAVRSAEARISAVDPFTSNDDTAYLGDMAPGESRTASYDVTVASGATPKIYGLDSEIRYRDALDNSQISDTIKVQVEVVQGEGLLAALMNPVVIILILAIIGGGLYYILVQRKKK
ncbi:MAG TPA: S-layer protein [Methanomicrobiales archaeon]|jgi:hypothetical protein|nr:S-layer protein [Methanomicrobiales archaeon]